MIARLVHWKLCCKNGLKRSEKWCEHQPDGLEEDERCNILWATTIQCDHIIKARRPVMIVVEKESNKAIIVDTASPYVMKRTVQRLRNTKIWRWRLENYRVSDVWKWYRWWLLHGAVSKRLDTRIDKLGITIRVFCRKQLFGQQQGS